RKSDYNPHMELPLDPPETPRLEFEPSVNIRDAAIAALRTLDLLERAGADIPSPDAAQCTTASRIFERSMGVGAGDDEDGEDDAPMNFTPPDSRPVPAITAPVAHHLRTMLREYDHAVVESAVQVRRYIVNKLLEETENADARVRLRALELLGKTADIDLFGEATRTPGAGAATTAQELEERIRAKIRGLTKVQDVKFKDIDPMKDVDL
ncbi:MAG TPA: hypothetical protein PKL84_00340, partial [Candidatus Hydrogenedentes bacterium]|nr:hypothetical protein [Candidatus Hydrogenedentota bacterium]